MPHHLRAVTAQARLILPGFFLSGVVAIAANSLADHYHAPPLLMALLLGLALSFLYSDPRCTPGIEFTASAVLRTGVALLGLRITLAQIAALGWEPMAVVVVSMVLTMALSVFVAKAMGFHPLFGFLSGGATAICGASAALAIAAALPRHPGKERATLFTIVGVSALSTLAMILFPMLAKTLGMPAQTAGIFIGGTIHDVAQVVGAGYSVSEQVGDTATVVKLVRVAMLLPVILCAAWITRSQTMSAPGSQPPLLPWFAAAFLALALVNGTGWLPPEVSSWGSEVSRWCLAGSMVAIGLKTQLRQLSTVGLKPVALMMGETAFLAALVLLLLRFT